MYSPFKYISSIVWKGRPIHLTFFVTRRCNARCPYCFYLRSDDTPAVSAAELSLEEIERISSSLGSLLWLAFSGGEIFLREDLVEIARTFYRNNKPAIMLFSTNGLLPGLIRDRIEAIVRSCPDSVIALKLSLDGLGEAHDALRSTPGSFDKTLQTTMLLPI
jgi:MoaA/NifB/PqqE/SkfB family radical SAM enzyme